ncbi:MAG: hypothetical protein K5989_01405 [Lachnospiraceae bacterium]|nr:hypothetical protein [Lachnospiraceae bacterium]
MAFERQREKELESEPSGRKNMPPEDEDTMIYDYRKRGPYFNEDKGIYTDAYAGGLNSDQDVFQRTTIFHVGNRSDRPEYANPNMKADRRFPAEGRMGQRGGPEV